jgi:hypothetical protein
MTPGSTIVAGAAISLPPKSTMAPCVSRPDYPARFGLDLAKSGSRSKVLRRARSRSSNCGHPNHGYSGRISYSTRRQALRGSKTVTPETTSCLPPGQAVSGTQEYSTVASRGGFGGSAIWRCRVSPTRLTWIPLLFSHAETWLMTSSILDRHSSLVGNAPTGRPEGEFSEPIHRFADLVHSTHVYCADPVPTDARSIALTIRVISAVFTIARPPEHDHCRRFLGDGSLFLFHPHFVPPRVRHRNLLSFPWRPSPNNPSPVLRNATRRALLPSRRRMLNLDVESHRFDERKLSEDRSSSLEQNTTTHRAPQPIKS